MRLAISIAVSGLTGLPLHAQVVSDGTSTSYNNVTNAFANITVGTNGSFTLLTLANNTLFTNSGNGVIGLNTTAKSNEVRLISPTARWLMNGMLYVGSNGAANRLVVSNGATVRNDGAGYLGMNVSSSNNIAVITGSGSLWTNANLLILGSDGLGNQLDINNGGVVRAASAFVGANLSSNNLMTVTGPGSAWSSEGDFRFGYGSGGNQLLISDGGQVQNATGTVGFNPTGRNNLAVVTGLGSIWSNQIDLIVGLGGSGNQLVVTNGGAVVNRIGYIGGSTTSGTNLVMVTGTNSLWNISQGFLVGSSSHNNQLVVSNGGLVSVVGSGNIGPTANGNGNTATVTGPGARWTMGTDLAVGSSGAQSGLIISNGGLVVNAMGTVGQNISSSNNTATISGSGSVWNNTSTLYFGSNGFGNRMLVSSGGVVRNGLAYVGLNSNSSNNLATITGVGSLWSNANALYFGYSGRANQLVVTNGGRLQGSLTQIGTDASSSSNQAIVTGPGSMWINTGELYLGLGSAGNQLVVSNAGAVYDLLSYVGFNPSSSNNLAVVTGIGSTWSNLYELYIGGNCAGNQLVVSNGGLTLNSISYVGASVSSSNNLALVTGVGSRWTNSLHFFLGNDGSRNQLIISNGAAVLTGGGGFLGYNAGANNNSATVTDAGTRWLISSNLYVGSNGALNRLMITNGALVANAVGTLGQNASSSSNVAVVTGAGSVWSNVTDLFVGLGGGGNQLIVANGGRAESFSSEIGNSGSSGNNLVLVTGTGSVWNNSDIIMLGRSGSGNQLVVSNGGVVSCSGAYFATSSSTRSNVLTVTGPGSVWNVGFISMGDDGSTSQMIVSNGGTVHSQGSTIGSGDPSSNNLVVVTGAGSLWSDNSAISIGKQGPRHQLIVSNGGTVIAAAELLLGTFATSTNNRVEVTGGSLIVSNAFGTGLLNVRRGTNVLSAGLVGVARLLITNTLGAFEFNGGTLSSGGTTNSNGRIFTVGNGASAATLQFQGGTHFFANDLVVASNASLIGIGTVIGSLTVQNGGVLAPGLSVGTLILSNSPVLQGTTIMEISKSGPTSTNDQLQVEGSINYGGSLTVTNIGSTALAAGDRFKLFSATTYAGAFLMLSLPSLGNGLIWTNKLLVDGSIEVVGLPIPKFTGISASGTNMIITGTNGPPSTSYVVLTSTNVALPLVSWTSIATNQFGPNGEFVFTNGISSGTPQRFYRLRWP